MPLEVNEIGIRMRVLGDGDAAGVAGSGEDGGGGGCGCEGEAAQAAMVETCVRRVLQILKAMEAR